MQGSPSILRSDRLDEIAEALPQRASTLAKLFLSLTGLQVSQTEVGVLQALSDRSMRITELARNESVTQPAITLLVNRLQAQGWVTREADPGDRRAVLVAITQAGSNVFAELRSQYRALLHQEMAILGDEDVETLARATDILDGLIERLKEREP